ncbi:MAG TPA: hypothetical protein V6C82_03165 [Chroococcales cyanobacterium]|jgi:hypothetical protein
MLERTIASKVLALVLLATTLSLLPGCGGDLPSRVQTAASSDKAVTRPADDTSAPKQDPAPSTPSRDPNDVPTNVLRPIPAVPATSKPGEVTMKAVANTATITPLVDAGVIGNGLRVVSVSATITWGKVQNANSYRVLRAIDNDNIEDLSKYSSIGNTTGKLGFFVDGGKVYGNLQPGRLYNYKVQALDSMGRVIATGNSGVKPLQPILPPAQIHPLPLTPGDTKPTDSTNFTWNKVQDCDGYYVEVFSATTMMPMWVGYKDSADGGGVGLNYGDSGKLIGTIPVVWSMMLTPMARYAWSVTATKSDSPDNASKATAFAKANTPLRFFIAP